MGTAVGCQQPRAPIPGAEVSRQLTTFSWRRARNETLRRLIGSSVVVGPASVSRRHERPSRIAVSRRSGKSRPPRWAARLQARVGSASASPPPVEPTNPGQRAVPSASLAWRDLCLLADAPMLPGWNAAGRGHSAQLPRDPRLPPHRAGERDPKRRPLVRPGLSSWWRFATYRLRRSCTALSGGRLTYARLRGRSPRLVA
jgi:hypothetical protein